MNDIDSFDASLIKMKPIQINIKIIHLDTFQISNPIDIDPINDSRQNKGG